MEHSTRTIGIAIASIIALGCLILAVVLSGPLPFHFKTVNAESTHDLLVAYAAKDTDGDGLPDWEEALYGTDPANPHSVSPSVTDGQAVAQGLVKPGIATATSTPVDVKSLPGVTPTPQTVTDQFARALFSQYLSQRPTTQPTPEEIAAFVEQAVGSLQLGQPSADAFTASRVTVAGSGSDALITYAAGAENAFAHNTVQLPKSEVDYLSDVIQKGDVSALTQVKRLGTAYTAIAKAYVAVPVPQEAAAPHLAVANALARLGGDITDMGAMQSDPLRGYLGLANYQNDVPALQTALASLNAVYASEQVTIPEGTTGSFFFRMLRNAAPHTP